MGLSSTVKSIFHSRDLGIRVERAAQLYPADTVDLFTITGGNIMLKSLFGITSVDAIPNVAHTVQLRANPTAGAAVVLSTAGGDLDNLAVGTMFGPTGTVGDPCGVGFAIAGFDNDFIIPIGTIDFVCGAATTPALIAFILHYVPLDPGAMVAVA